MSEKHDPAKMRAQFEKERRKVDVDSLDVSVRELVRMTAEGSITVAPEYQRNFRWSEETQSQLVESLLIGLPVPSIFVAVNRDGGWELVDGLQRLSTLIRFVGDEEALSVIGQTESLVLTGLEKLSSFNGCTKDQLPVDILAKLETKFVRVISISDKSDYVVRFEAFERLNRGGVKLTEQEVRACVYRGAFGRSLRELAGNACFVSLLKLQRAHRMDGTPEELVLKYFAYKNKRNDFRGKVTGFLNEYMESRADKGVTEKERALFCKVCERLSDSLGGEPFLRRNVNVTPQNQLEASMVALAEILEDGLEPVGLEAAGWVNDKKLVKYSTGATNTKKMLDLRVQRARELFLGVEGKTTGVRRGRN